MLCQVAPTLTAGDTSLCQVAPTLTSHSMSVDQEDIARRAASRGATGLHEDVARAQRAAIGGRRKLEGGEYAGDLHHLDRNTRRPLIDGALRDLRIRDLSRELRKRGK